MRAGSDYAPLTYLVSSLRSQVAATQGWRLRRPTWSTSRVLELRNQCPRLLLAQEPIALPAAVREDRPTLAATPPEIHPDRRSGYRATELLLNASLDLADAQLDASLG